MYEMTVHGLKINSPRLEGVANHSVIHDLELVEELMSQNGILRKMVDMKTAKLT